MAKTAEQKTKWNAYMREYNRKNYDPVKEKVRSQKKYSNNRTEGFSVYYLPEEHYVGMTNNLNRRLSHHKHTGKIIDNFEIVCYFKRQVDAHLYETWLHAMGYHGFFVGHYNENYGSKNVKTRA